MFLYRAAVLLVAALVPALSPAAAPPVPQPVRPRLVRVAEGRRGTLRALAFSPDGRTLAAGHGSVAGPDGRPRGALLLYEAAGLRKRAALPLPTVADSSHKSVAFLPGGRHLAVAYLRRVLLWDLANQKVEFEFPSEDPLLVIGVAAPPAGNLLAIVWPRHVALWDVKGRRRVGELRGNTGFLYGAAFSPDGRTLAAADRKVVRLWDVASGRERAVLEGHEGAVHHLAFSPCGRLLASGDHALALQRYPGLWSFVQGEDRKRRPRRGE